MENKIFKLFILNHDHALSKVNSSIMVSNFGNKAIFYT